MDIFREIIDEKNRKIIESFINNGVDIRITMPEYINANMSKWRNERDCSGYYAEIIDYICSEIKEEDKEYYDFDEIESKYNEIISKKILLLDKKRWMFIVEYLREDSSYHRIHGTVKDNPRGIEMMNNLLESTLLLERVIMNNINKLPINSLDHSTYYLNEIIKMAELGVILEQNKQTIKAKENIKKITCIDNELFKLFEIEDNDRRNNISIKNQYFLEGNHLEEDEIKDKGLRNKLRCENKDLLGIVKRSNETIFKYFGFKISDLQTMIDRILNDEVLDNYGEENKITKHSIIIKQRQFKSIFENDICPDNINNIIKQLSINYLMNKIEKPKLRSIELRPIFMSGENLYFGKCDLLNYITVLKNIIISGHYGKELALEEEMIKNYESDMLNMQKQMSEYLSYKVADVLINEGVEVLRNEDDEVWVDVQEFDIDGKRLIFNDIDVLAVNREKKEVYNIELKYYKIQYDEFVKSNNNSLDFKRKHGNTFNKRYKKLEQYKSQILKKYFKIYDGDNYSIRNLMITSRTIFSDIPDWIEFYNYYEFNHKTSEII